MNSRPTIENINITDADTEYSYELPEGTKRFSIKLRDLGHELKVCFVSGEDTNYINVSSGKSYSENNIKGSKNTLYFKSPSVSQTAEIISWI